MAESEFGPKIHYSPDTGEAGPPEDDRLNRELMFEGMFGRGSSYSNFDRALKDLAKTEDEKKPEAREKVERSYAEMMNEHLDQVTGIQNQMFNLHNPYPYDSRWGQDYFDRVSSQVENNLRNKKTRKEKQNGKSVEVNIYDDEARSWLRRVKRDTAWAKSSFRILQGLGPAMDFYYDGDRQLTTLKTLHDKINADDFIGAFAKELSDGDVETAKEGEGLRERAVKFQDDIGYWRLAISGASQWDYDNPPQEDPVTDAERRQMFLSSEELDFIYKVFGPEENSKGKLNWFNYIDKKGNSHKVPTEILNFYVTAGKEDQIREVRAKMEALLRVGAKDRLENIISKDPSKDVGVVESVEDIINEVKALAEERIKAWDVDSGRSVENRLAEAVVSSAIITDWGFMSSGELGWGWKYEVVNVDLNDPKQEDYIKQLKERGYEVRKESEVVEGGDLNRSVFLLRTSDLGGIYSAFDVSTMMFWARHIVSYDDNSETRSQFMPPTAGGWRVKWQDLPPYQAPEVSINSDQILLRMLDRLKGDGGANFRNQEPVRSNPGGEKAYFGDLDKRVIEFMDKKENRWYYQTPFFSNHVQADQLINLPVFFPADVQYLSFWRGFHLDSETTQTGRRGRSVWHQMLEKTPTSSFKWESMGPQVVDWYRVNMDMTQRWLSLMVNPHKFSNQATGEYEKFFLNPSTGSLKELAKRIRLGTRPLKETEVSAPGVLEIALIPFLVTLSMIDKHNLSDRLTWVDNTKIGKWREEVAEWVNAALNLPKSKGTDPGSVEPYGNSIALMMYFYSALVARYAKAASDQSGKEVQEVKNFVEKTFKETGVSI